MKNKFKDYSFGIFIVFIGCIFGVLVDSYIADRYYKKYIKTPLVEVKYMNSIIYQDTCIIDSIKIYRK